MPYIGTSPSNGVRRIFSYTASAGQTTFSGPSTEGATLAYADTTYIDVYQNGVLLDKSDYTSTNGTEVELDTGASASDVVVIIVYDVFSVADTVSKTDGGTFDGAVTVSGAFTSPGIDDNADATAITIDSSENVTLGSGKELRFVDTNESIQSDGSKMILKSGGTTFNLPTSDGSANQALVTDGSGTLSFAAAGASLSNDSNNRVVTADGSGGLNGESGLIYTSNVALDINRSSDGTIVAFKRANSQQGYIHIFVGGVTYNTTSDYRLKENITDVTNATTRLKQLKPKRFNFIADEKNTIMEGFLAHEVSDVVPEAVTGEKDEVDSDGNPVYQGIDQSKLVPLLVKTIQELEARIAVLESK